MRYREAHIWRGAVAGIAGGLVAAWTMNRFQALLRQTSDQPSKEGEDATQKAAEAVAEPILDRPLTRDEKRTAGPAVHYAFAALMGGLYGALAEKAPIVSRAAGMPFGAGLWFGADEVAVPGLGLAPKPSETSASTHMSALAAHLVYGVTTDLVRRAMRAAW